MHVRWVCVSQVGTVEEPQAHWSNVIYLRNAFTAAITQNNGTIGCALEYTGEVFWFSAMENALQIIL